MADVENELKDLREKNNELVQKVQYWKMTAAQRESEKLDLMKEINDLRLKISRLRSGGAANALKLDAALQSASEEALSHLVQASSAVARTLELAKTYVQERQELDTALPRWSTLSSTPSSEKINIVPPMLIGGRLIQPVVSLSRTLQSNISRSASRSPNEQNHSVSERAVPLHMLQDVYIPLTRIDAGERPVNNADTDMEVNHADNSTEDLALDDSAERMMEESQNITESEDFEESRRLDVVSEDIEPEDGLTPERSRIENPLEGPSWLLDRPSSKRKIKSSTNLEPDSTTEFEDTLNAEPGPSHSLRLSEESHGTGAEPAPVCEFSPTVRRRRRTSPPATPHATPRAAASPHYSPRPARRYSNNGRILKVLVAKMRLDDDITNVSPPKRSKEETPPKSQRNNPNHPDARKQTGDGSPKYQVRDISPSKRLMRFDAPSPNGSTDSRVIVLEAKNNQPEPGCSGVSKAKTSNRINSIDGRNNRISNNNHDHNNQEESNNSQTDRNRNQSSDNNRSRDNHNRDSHNHDNRKRDSRNRDGHSNISVDGNNSRDSRDSDSSGSEMASEGRTRRPRKAIVYKEKPLNRKLRR